MSSNFPYQQFLEVSENLGCKVLVVDDDLSCHEQEIHPTTSLDENCIVYELQKNRNYYDDLRQTYLAFKLKIVKVHSYETYSATEVKKN